MCLKKRYHQLCEALLEEVEADVIGVEPRLQASPDDPPAQGKGRPSTGTAGINPEERPGFPPMLSGPPGPGMPHRFSAAHWSRVL